MRYPSWFGVNFSRSQKSWAEALKSKCYLRSMVWCNSGNPKRHLTRENTSIMLQFWLCFTCFWVVGHNSSIQSALIWADLIDINVKHHRIQIHSCRSFMEASCLIFSKLKAKPLKCIIERAGGRSTEQRLNSSTLPSKGTKADLTSNLRITRNWLIFPK